MSSSDGTATEQIVEVEFLVDDPQYPLAALSSETGCKAELLQILPRSDDAYTVFQRITNASSTEILEFARGYEGYDARVVSETDESVIVEFRISGSGAFFVVSLTDAGAIPTELGSEDGVAHIIVEIPAGYSASTVIDRFQDAYPSMEMVARRQKDYPMPRFQCHELREMTVHMLTTRQHEVLMLAYMRGYYDWPREKSGDELAEELDVTPATFFQHLRTAERKLLSLLFRT